MTDLTPSEVVWLRASEFASPAGGWRWPGVEPLGSDEQVKTAEIGPAVLRTALLCNEQDGALSFAEGTRETLMGLREHPTLLVERGEATPEWPAGSLEARILARLDRSADGGVPLGELVHSLFDRDSASPYGVLLDWVTQGLVERDLVDVVEKKKWGIFTSRKYELPESTAAMVEDGDVAEAHRLLAEAENTRPEFWAVLTAEVDRAVNSRTYDTDDMDWD